MMHAVKLSSDHLGSLPPPVRELRGFVEYCEVLNVSTTYKSHTFYLHEEPRADGSFGYGYISVHHGGGREAWRVDRKIYDGVEALIASGAEKQAFFLCWGLTKALGEAQVTGMRLARQKYEQAFVEGRLRKRKQRGHNAYKVWVDPVAVETPKTAHEELARRHDRPIVLNK